MIWIFRNKRLRKRREARGLAVNGLLAELMRAGFVVTETSIRNWENEGHPTTLSFLLVVTAIGDPDEVEAAGLLLDRYYERTKES